MATYRLLTLGALRVETADGEPVEFPAGKPLALLIRLAIGPEPPTRRELVGLLWPRSTTDRGLQSVRQALWFLRRTLGEDVLDEDGVLRLRAGAVTSDVADLESALRENRLADADSFWRGPFLHRFAVPDAPEWDRWVDDVADRASRQLAGALFADAVRHREAGDLPASLHQLERAVEIAPFEPRYRERLVEWLVEVRDLPGAEQALEEARRAVGEADRYEGLERLSAGVEGLRSDRAASPEERFARPDLVGRSAELADLMALWRRAERGNRRIALLTGPAGIGKTRLADEFARTIQHEGASTVTVRAAEVEHAMEYGVVASLARALLQMSGAAGISTLSDSLLRGLVPSLPVRGAIAGAPNGERVNPAALADALADLIGAVAWERPLLVTVDDAGWADPPSISVLSRALRTLREGAVMVAMTARTAGGVGDVLRPLESIRGDVTFGTIRLRPLTLPETHELVSLLVELPEGAGARRLLDRIHATTGGNPFFVIELIRAFLDERLISTEGGNLVLDLSRLDEAAPWPRTVRALVRRRFDRLSPPARALGHLLATVSPRDPETAARRLAGLGRRAYGLALSELLEHGIVAWDGSTLTFTHAELREAAASWVEEEATRPVWRRWTRTGIAGTTVVAALAVFAVFRVAGIGESTAERASPWGGGDILVAAGDSALVFRAEWSGDSIVLTASRPVFRIPDLDRLNVFRTVAGRNLWFRLTRDLDRGPDLMRVDTVTFEQTPFSAEPGDESFDAVSPDGAWVVFGSNDTTTPYDQGLHMARIDGSARRPPVWNRRTFDWSRDGRWLLVLGLGQPDTFFVTTPAGEVVASRTGGWMTGLFCGTDGRIAVFERQEGLGRILTWSPKDGDERLVTEGAIRLDACSPDGGAALVTLVRDQHVRSGVLDLEDGAFRELGVTPGPRIRPAWLADGGKPVPAALVLDADSVSVDWGGIDTIVGLVTLSDGTREEADVRWASSDSSVATVAPEGALWGNRPGTATITGCVDGWICDTAVVNVRRSTTAALLFEDRFQEPPAPGDWITLGSPVPRAVTAPDGETVLFLNGDGIWQDGLISRDGYPLDRGATLEIQFRFRGSLTRRDRQKLVLCLGRWDPPTALVHLEEEPAEKETVCVHYPADELRHFAPDVASFTHYPGVVQSFIHMAELPPVGWTHLEIQVNPDGRAFLFVNRRQIAELPVRVEGTAFDDWHVRIAGHSVDTHLEVRYLTLWQGTRD